MFSVDVIDLDRKKAVRDTDGNLRYREFTLYFEERGQFNAYVAKSSRSKRVRVIGQSFGVFPPKGVLTEEEKRRRLTEEVVEA